MFKRKKENRAEGLALTPDSGPTIVGWRRMEPELRAPAWRKLRAAAFATAVAAIAASLGPDGGAFASWATAVTGAAAWVAVLRFLEVDIHWARFWRIWLALGLLAPVYAGSGPVGRSLGLGMSLLLLLLRRYRPLALLGSRRRAWTFVFGLLLLILLGLVDAPPAAEESAAATGTAAAIAWVTLWSLRFFWLLALLRLFFGMRLHFLKLRPKLAVSGLFVALVPTLLVVALAVVAGYGVLGAGRAATGRGVMEEWSRAMDTGAGAFEDAAGFAWRRGEDAAAAGAPEWINGFAAAYDAAAAGDSLRALPFAADTTAYFVFGGRVWLLRVRGEPGRGLDLRGHPVGPAELTRLARLLRADVGLFTSSNFNFGNGTDGADLQVDLHGRFTEAVPDSVPTPFHRRPLGFGGSVVGVYRLAEGRFEPANILLHLSVRPVDLLGELFRGEANRFNQVVLIGLAVVAGLFLVVVALALFFGVRITNGITGAVRGLQGGTRRLAAGDLDTYIDIPNEDELGDLALSFNDMTAAIRRGHQEAIERERLERELSTARDIQQRLLPHEFPELPGFELTGVSVPSLEVGGDYFDFLDQGDGRVGVAIGDVSGKGMPAALLMANLQASLQGQVIHPSSVAEVVACVNDLLVRSTDAHMFATFFYGVLDRGAAAFTSTNAGHNPPLLVRADGSCEYLDQGGLLIGMLPGQEYRQQTVTMDPGDVLVMYTDGITEAVGPDPEGAGSPAERRLEDEIDPESMFGEERLLSVVRDGAGLPAAALRESILRAVNDFTAGMAQSDDITLVVIRRKPEV